MPYRYRRYGEPITAFEPSGLLLELWQDDTNRVFDKYNHPYKNTSFEREYSLRYMGEKIPVRAPSKDIISELEDVP